jgi:hypothetical protein
MQLGDANRYFGEIGGQSSKRNAMAAGGEK